MIPLVNRLDLRMMSHQNLNRDEIMRLHILSFRLCLWGLWVSVQKSNSTFDDQNQSKSS